MNFMPAKEPALKLIALYSWLMNCSTLSSNIMGLGDLILTIL
jgi:hypothetical protein